MPLGVSSNFRYWGATHSPVVARAQGCHTWDLDGNRYIDYRLGFGPIILGHAHPAVCDRVNDVMRQGTVTASLTELETLVAERIIRMCPGVESVRFANSGTEATMHALRIARAFTGRDVVLKFEGQYHGMYDYMLWSTASAIPSALGARRNPILYQQSSGIPACLRDLVIALPYNDPEGLKRTLRHRGHQLAAIIVEPILGNCGSIEPQPGWLQLLRDQCDEYEILLIFDEVKTGFRIAPGGAQETSGVRADLATYAKAMANGFPAAAIGGRADVMQIVGRGVSQGGTYCSNAVGMAAADATLSLLEDGSLLRQVNAQGDRLKAGLRQILADEGIPHLVKGPGSMFGILLTDAQDALDFRDFGKTDAALYEAIAMELVERGVIPDPDAREPWFLCAAHDDAAIDETLDVFADAVKQAKSQGHRPDGGEPLGE
jgi:glutamate-1-semialdehyde 2,1-aminomutase